MKRELELFCQLVNREIRRYYTPTFHKITLQESARAGFERLDWH
jgi:hypothetical protein